MLLGILNSNFILYDFDNSINILASFIRTVSSVGVLQLSNNQSSPLLDIKKRCILLRTAKREKLYDNDIFFHKMFLPLFLGSIPIFAGRMIDYYEEASTGIAKYWHPELDDYDVLVEEVFSNPVHLKYIGLIEILDDILNSNENLPELSEIEIKQVISFLKNPRQILKLYPSMLLYSIILYVDNNLRKFGEQVKEKLFTHINSQINIEIIEPKVFWEVNKNLYLIVARLVKAIVDYIDSYIDDIIDNINIID